MPIHMEVPLAPVSDAEFDRVDYQVMGLAYEIHNAQGRLCDERIYQSLLASRCEASGLASVIREAPIRVTYESFEKNYYLDLLVNQGIVLELKTVEALTAEHKQQIINYLLMAGLHHGKLINMRPESVEGQRVLTQLTPKKRRQLHCHEHGWRPIGDHCSWFKQMAVALFQNWGGFLSVSLYQEAIIHFLGGRETAETQVDFIVGSQVVGRQKVKLLDDTTAFEMTAVKDKPHFYEEHLRRLLRHTDLRAIQWVNMINHDITFKTIR